MIIKRIIIRIKRRIRIMVRMYDNKKNNKNK